MNKFQRRKEKLKGSLGKLPARVHAIRRVLARRMEPASGQHAIAFKIAGGLGDYLIAARFARDLAEQCGDLVFDVYSPKPQLAAWVFGQIEGFRDALDTKIESGLTRSLYLCTFELFNYCRAQYLSPKLKTDLPSNHPLRQAIDALSVHRANLALYAFNRPYLDGYLGDMASMLGQTRHTFCHHLANIPYSGHRLPILSSQNTRTHHELEGTLYVTVSNGFDADAARQAQDGTGVTKVFDHHGEVIAEIKRRHPEVQVIQIGAPNSHPIAGVDRNLVGLTSLQEAAALLEGSALHIDNEGGLVHLAAAMGARSAVFFGPTPAHYFGYEGNLNFAPQVCGNCWWKTQNWMTNCVRPGVFKACMVSQDLPAAIAAILSHLDVASASMKVHSTRA